MLVLTVTVLSAAWSAGSSAAAAPLRHATALTSNWAGYALTGSRSGAGTRFSRVSAIWRQPAGSCTPGLTGYAAFWIGLGGYARSSRALEQTGTEVDCSASGRAVYYAWYELLPADPVIIRVAVHPRDRIAARVAVSRRRVSVSLRDLTTGAGIARTLSMAAPDTSSAEWVVEAPSSCNNAGRCQVLPLANFSSASFSQASASGSGRTGSIAGSAWTAVALELQDSASGAGRFAPATGAAAIPSALGSGGSSFSITWHQTSATRAVRPAVGPRFSSLQARLSRSS